MKELIKFYEGDFRLKTDDYFELSGVREWEQLKHTPFIVFNINTTKKEKEDLEIKLKNIKKLLKEEYSKDILDSCKKRKKELEEELKNFNDSVSRDSVEIKLVDNLRILINNYSPETQVLGQWRGKWSSDFFAFKVQDAINYVKKNPKEDYHVI